MSDARPEGLSKLTVRVVVGACYFLVVVGCLFAGITATCVAVSIMACMCCWEFLRLCHTSGRIPNDGIALLVTALYPLAPLLNYGNVHMLATMVLLLALAVWYVAVPRVSISDVALTAFAPIYCGFSFSAVSLIRACDPGLQGALLAFGVLGSIWLNDTFAYFVGSKFGKHKLAPRISPNKSVEGFWGGIAGCVLIWIVMVVLRVRGLGLLYALLCGVCVGFMSVFGDLFESRIKRGFGVKDSGNLMPGHGGMLDRSDALLFGCMIAFLLLKLGRFV